MFATRLKVEMRIFATALLGVAALLNALAAIAADGRSLQSGTAAAQLPPSRQVRDFSDQMLAKIVPGHTTKADVGALLGNPWRDTQLDEEDMVPGDTAVEVWEYRGRGPQGTYRVHIQFDKRGVTTLIAKIPDKTGRAVARVANPAANPGKP